MLFKNPRALGVSSGGGGGGVDLPAGVSLRPIDGETLTSPNVQTNNFYARGYFNGVTQVPFSYAIDSRCNGMTGGWDNVNFFPIGGWLLDIDVQADADRWNALGWNTMWASTSATKLSVLRANNISLLAIATELFTSSGGGLIPNNGGSLGTETVGLLPGDEPGGSLAPISDPIAGNVPGGPLTNAIQDGRLWWENYAGPSWFGFGDVGGVPAATVLSNAYPTPNGTTRYLNLQSADLYFMSFTRGFLHLQQTESDVYEFSHSPMTQDQGARGTHYGDMVDVMRSYATVYSTPIFQFVETGNNKGQVAYDIAPQEMDWAVWASIIHGARGIQYFDIDDQSSWSTGLASVTGFMATAYAQAQQQASFTGSIAGSPPVLTVTAISSGHIQSGMTITSGAGTPNPTILGPKTLTAASFTGTATGYSLVTSGTSGTITLPASLITGTGLIGDPVIYLQNSGTTGGNGTYTLSLAGPSQTAGPTAMTCTSPGGLGDYYVSGGSGSGAMVAQQTQSIYNQVRSTNALIKAMAPVLNSPFAINYAVPSPQGYVFPNFTKTFAFGTATGIDCMVKFYTGPTISTSRYSGFNITGDSITAGFYIFATTRNSEKDTAISVTFTLTDPLAISVTRINDPGHTFTVARPAGTFTDTFDFAWQTRIYKVNH